MKLLIISFKHKGLEQYFETGSKKEIQPDHASKLGRILDRLDASVNPKDMNLSSFKLHQLKGKEKIDQPNLFKTRNQFYKK
ncbi:type II toxin-antitoxin system RelE/ParE family toxin [Leptospira interrogans]|uniref:type II toxin-antitoxin system RelE/ParE family toxin n=1 Tax=Leptospira interrogans TaxID=173 RepID=UPI00122D38B3|nr:type II toxin-antitoxin system RelE/ParE family toxin [Leptospira interrogans]KAA1268673.1 plasmid maintenance system killer protein [Leptospira interrogans serovar Weerasinghe]ULG81393.1 type II toxin-antitoxin system RelE/ParE family toxin [Leptospira interrogans]UML69014.1 type II toxin-antitoxin system RelE/ParE family toxin [Leptospira interrogans]UML72339.1 type II toxin-antitoxin system RelE/ParE family toxin [Leptospira interrogans]